MPRSVKEWIGKTDDSMPTQAVRLRLWEAARGLCQECGFMIGPKEWHADHIVRLKDGGENRETNLQVLCLPCHREKTGEENKLGAKANRMKARHVGIKRVRNPMPGSKASNMKKCADGRVIDRRTGREWGT